MVNDLDCKNIFTAYVMKALRRCKAEYLRKEYRYRVSMILVDECMRDRFATEADTVPLCFEERNRDNIIECIGNDKLLLAVLKLTERERKILSLKVAYKMTHVEIAELLGLSCSVVEKAYQRAILKIRKKLKGDL